MNAVRTRFFMRAAVTACFLLAPAASLSASEGTAPLLERIAALEARVSALEGRSVAGTPAAASSKWKDAEKWRQLRSGMTETEVIELLGPPTSGTRHGGGANEGVMMVYQEIAANDLASSVTGMIQLLNGRVQRWDAPYFP